MTEATTKLATRISKTVHPLGGDKHRIDDIERILRPLVEAVEAAEKLLSETDNYDVTWIRLAAKSLVPKLRAALYSKTETSDD